MREVMKMNSNNVVNFNTPMFLSIKEAVKVTGLSEYYFRQNLKAGKIPHLRQGNKILINMPQLLESLNKMVENSLVKL